MNPQELVADAINNAVDEIRPQLPEGYDVMVAHMLWEKTLADKFADNRGYLAEVANPAFEQTMNEDGSLTDNGEPRVIKNPQTRKEFVQNWFKKQVVEMFSIDYKRTAEVEAKKAADVAAQAAKDALDAAIVIS